VQVRNIDKLACIVVSNAAHAGFAYRCSSYIRVVCPHIIRYFVQKAIGFIAILKNMKVFVSGQIAKK